MAQAIAFRAFGAAGLSFDTDSEVLGYYHSSASRTNLLGSVWPSHLRTPR